MWGKFTQGLKENAGELAGDWRGGLAKLQDVVAPPVVKENEEDNVQVEAPAEDSMLPLQRIGGFGALISRIVAPIEDSEEQEEYEEEELEDDEEPIEDFEQSLPKTSFRQLLPLDLSPIQKERRYDKALDVKDSNIILSESSHDASSLKSIKFLNQTSSISNGSLDIEPEPTLSSNIHAIDVKTEVNSNFSSSEPSVLQEKDKQIRELEAKCRALQLIEAQHAYDSMVLKEQEAKILSLESQYQELQSSHLNQIKQKDKDVCDLKRSCEELERQVQSYPSILEEKENLIQKLEQQCLLMQKQNSTIEISVRERESRMADLEQICGALQGKLEEKVMELKATQQELQNRPLGIEPKTLEEKEESIRRLEKTCSDLQNQVNIERSLVKEKDGSIHELVVMCQTLRSDLEKVKAREPPEFSQSDLMHYNSIKQELEAVKKQNMELQTLSDPILLKEKDDKILQLEQQCQDLQMEIKRQFDHSKLHSRQSLEVDSEMKRQVVSLEKKCRDLESLLQQRENHILEMQKEAVKRMEADEKWRETQLLKFKQEQAAMLEANTESVAADYRLEMDQLVAKFSSESNSLREQLNQQLKEADQKQRKLEQLLQETTLKLTKCTAEAEAIRSKADLDAKEKLHKQGVSVRQLETKLSEAKAVIDSKTEELKKLQAAVKDLQTKVKKSEEKTVETDEELEHLREENETLHHNWQVTEDENDELKKQIDEMSKNETVISELRKEIHELKLAKEMQKAEIESKVDSVESNKTVLQEERDAALASVRSLEHQLSAMIADLQVANADKERAILGNENLSRALDTLQHERDAEIAFLEDQRRSSEEATAAAHAAAIQATYEANRVQIRQVQAAADAAIKQISQEMDAIKAEWEREKKEKLQVRRSLDEAISRLRASQEDVVDRSLMKNVLLDWFARSGKSKEQVLEIMANLLHFTEEEKNKIHLFDGNAISQVISSVATLPPSKVDVQQLEGDNVRDKFINFLLSETDDI